MEHLVVRRNGMKNPIQSLIRWFKLEAELVDAEQKHWYTYRG